MALVLASQPVKHPNYHNGDHYAVLDTDTGNVGYFTLVEIQKDIDDEGTQFIGNHPLAIRDNRERHNKGFIERSTDMGKLVYYISTNNIVIVEFNNTHNLILCRYDAFKESRIKDYLELSVWGIGIVGERNLMINYKHIYSVWNDIIRRAAKYISWAEQWYSDVKLYNNWLFFPNFLNWYLGQPNYTQKYWRF